MPSKRTVYIVCAVFLGLLLGDIVYDLFEISYLDSSMLQEDAWYADYGKSLFALRPLPEVVFDLAGMLLGYRLGKVWWRIIYVEDRRHKKYRLDW